MTARPEECHTKRRYASRSKANRAVDGIRRTGDRRGGGKPARAYHCPHCKGYHLTSQPKGYPSEYS